MKSVLFLSVFSAALVSTSSRSYKVVCYFRSWASLRSGDGNFTVENIDPSLCTHLVYGFARLQDNKITVRNSALDLTENGGLGAYQRFNDLKRNNTSLKTLISIGGWNKASEKYSRMVASPGRRQQFINSSVSFLEEHGFDGLDLDWEYINAESPNEFRGPQDKQNFALLLKEMKEAFQPHGFLLTAYVSPIKRTIDLAYPIEALSQNLDFISLMAYDFHQDWDKVTVHNAPLYSSPNEADKTLNVNYSVNYWLLSKNFSADKLILGMSFYGRGFTLEDPENNGLGAPVIGRSMLGQSLEETGLLSFNEICMKIRNENGWTVVFDRNIKAPYTFKNSEWIGYNDPRSIRMKVNYLKRKNLGGAMVFALENDDFRGKCYNKKYPLLKTIKDGLGDDDATESVDQ